MLNLFFIKESLSFQFKHLLYIHNFINISNKFKVKSFKTVNILTVKYIYVYLVLLNLILIILFNLNVKKKMQNLSLYFF